MERLTSGGLGDVLERVGPAIAAGAVNVISVAAIRDRSGPRWARRREQVEDFVERAFARMSSAGGLIVALNDIEYLAIHADSSRWAALNLSANILKETLAFFVGAVAREDVRLMQVTGFNQGELTVESVDVGGFMPSEAPAWGVGGRGTACDSVPPSHYVVGHGARAITLVAGDLRVDATHLARPTWNVRDRVVASFVVETKIDPEHTAALPPLLAAEVARSNLAFAVEQIRAGRDGGTPVAMHVPVPIGALTITSARYPLLHFMRDLDAATRRLLVVELTDLEAGVPHSRLSESVSMLAPYARAVLARAPSETASLLEWRRSGLHGVTLDCSHLQSSDRAALFRLSTFARNALAIAPACVGYSLTAMSLLVAAWGAGFTHLSGAAVSGEIRRLAAVRLTPRELYRRSSAARMAATAAAA
jgi:hypothetical protein